MRRTASGASCPVSTLIGRPLADERGKGREGKPGGFPLAFLGTRGDLGAARVEAYLKEEGGSWGKHGFPHGSEPKTSDAHSAPPSLHQPNIQPQLVERTADDEVDKVVDALRSVVEARRQKEDRRARLPQLEHVPQVDGRERRLPGHQDQLPLLLEGDG